MKNWLMLIVATIVLGGCSTLQVQVDYDAEHDFSSLSTFAIVYAKKNDEKDFSKSRISKLLEIYMQDKGYKNVDKMDADFYITMHFDVQKKSQVETNYETIGIRPMPYSVLAIHRPLGQHLPIYTSGMMAFEPETRVTTRTYEYEEGKLILEAFDVKQNIVFWQGIAKDELSTTEMSQEEKSDYINEVIAKLFKDFPSKK
jgi:homoserine acetyltransferase